MRDQIEITQSTELLTEDGKLAVTGWAKKNIFDYNRRLAKPRCRLKEWDYYQISDGEYLVKIFFYNVTIASNASACIIDLKTGKHIASSSMQFFTKKKFCMPRHSDVPNFFRYESNGTVLQFDTRRTCRKLEYSGKAIGGKPFKVQFELDLLPEQENITTVTPFEKMPTRFFLSTKLNCMPCEGKVMLGESLVHTFHKDKSFATLDWGRGVWPYKNEWYWGSGATRIDDEQGNSHIFGFNLTWKIGDDSNATQNCLFYDGKAHKIGAVDIEKSPVEENKWMQEWHIVSDDGRLDLTMSPSYDSVSGAIVFGLGMKSHQVHGLWNGYVVLDDGTKLEIKDMYAFCEYTLCRW